MRLMCFASDMRSRNVIWGALVGFSILAASGLARLHSSHPANGNGDKAYEAVTKGLGSSILGEDRSIDSTDGTYLNERFDFSFKMPAGYRLATECMSFLNSISGYPILDWSATNTQQVVIAPSTSSQDNLPCQNNGIGLDPVSIPGNIYLAVVADSPSHI